MHSIARQKPTHKKLPVLNESNGTDLLFIRSILCGADELLQS